jgi:hypothetical protein
LMVGSRNNLNSSSRNRRMKRCSHQIMSSHHVEAKIKEFTQQ